MSNDNAFSTLNFQLADSSLARIQLQTRQNTRLSVDFGCELPRARCSHLFIKGFSIRISDDLYFGNVLTGRLMHRVNEKLLTNALTDLIRQNPHVFQLCFIVLYHECVKAQELSLSFSNENLIVMHKIWRKR